MSDAVVRIFPDSTGKKVDTEELTVGSNTVERQRVQLAGAAAAAIAAILATDPDGSEYGLAVRAVEPMLPRRFDKVFDLSGSTYWYIGFAPLATATSAASWLVKRITLSSGLPTAIQFTAGSQIWDNRVSLTYT